MQTTALRLYGKKDLRLETFELPPIKPDEVLVKIISDSVCMSTYKAATQGPDHKRVPNNVAENPTIVGHEFCGEIVEVGDKWRGKYMAGTKFSVQPAHNYKGSQDAPGYSYPHIGGDMTYGILPPEIMIQDCLLSYEGEGFFKGSLAEPMSCIIGAFHANYHIKSGTYVHDMDIKPGGTMLLAGACGPMGLGAIDYAVHRSLKPRLIVVTEVDDARLARASQLISPDEASKHNIELKYINTAKCSNAVQELKDLTGGQGYDDAFVFAPVKPLIEAADAVLGRDGCLNFFAGPTNTEFKADFNFYNVHYAGTHIVGTSGGNTDDMKEALDLMSKNIIDPSMLVTHVGGIDSAKDTILNLPHIPGGKKLLYTTINLPLTAIDDFEEKGKETPLFAELHRITVANNGLWCEEAEKYLLDNAR